MIKVKLPESNPPDAGWNAMKTNLINGNIDGAISYFASASAEKYRQAYLSIGATGLAPIISQIPAIIPIYIENDAAQYRFDEIIGGRTLSFPIEFRKENGIWKILEY